MQKGMVEEIAMRVELLVRIKPTRILAEKDIAAWD